MTKKKIQPVVTDHAVLRFIERHLNIDVDNIKRLICEACFEAVQKGLDSVGHGGVVFFIENKRFVVTCVDVADAWANCDKKELTERAVK
jgi:hypothetical protein